MRDGDSIGGMVTMMDHVMVTINDDGMMDMTEMIITTMIMMMVRGGRDG